MVNLSLISSGDISRDFARGTFLEEAPMVPVSSQTAEGITEFIETLDKLAAQIPERRGRQALSLAHQHDLDARKSRLAGTPQF